MANFQARSERASDAVRGSKGEAILDKTLGKNGEEWAGGTTDDVDCVEPCDTRIELWWEEFVASEESM